MNIVSVFVSLLSVDALPSFLHKIDIRYSGQQFAILSRTFLLAHRTPLVLVHARAKRRSTQNMFSQTGEKLS